MSKVGAATSELETGCDKVHFSGWADPMPPAPDGKEKKRWEFFKFRVQ
jgi:hypothetical protein